MPYEKEIQNEKEIHILSELRSEYSCFDPNEREYYHALTEAIRSLVSKRHGYWEWTDDPRTGDFVCSSCLDHNIVRSRYCPNCGAKMDEVEEDA